ncbi:MAG: chromosome segregation protein SMC [Methylophaga sp.]|nr:MAG: chromosome segregation protein SMC [Methylophaga sp.]
MSQLETITIEGFKSISSIKELKLNAINIVIGPNGSGKSNFIGVFSFLHAIRAGNLQDYIIKGGGANKILHFGEKTTPQLHIKISFNNKSNEYSIKLEPTEADELIPTQEVAYFWNKEYRQPLGHSVARDGKEAGISNKQTSDHIISYVKEHLTKWRAYHFHDTSSSSPMKKTVDINDNQFLRSDGSNIASFLYYLQEKHETSYDLIKRTIQRVAPFFEDFRLAPQQLNAEKIRLEWKHKGSDDYFDASSLSDGTLRFIALTTLFLQPDAYKPSVILVDEPELGLHPYAITLLASLIKQASINTQVIISTQSPLLLDHFNPEDILIADRQNGGTVLSRLESSKKLDLWLEEYGLGQLWEKNEFGGRPQAE